MKKLLAFSILLFTILSAFAPHKKNKLRLPPEFVFIPGGTKNIDTGTGRVNKEVLSTSSTIASFHISKFEITNQQYKQFYNEEEMSLSNEEKKVVACDTNGWNQTLRYGEPLVTYYYQHPAYNNYPVVNISYEGAARYCQWLQKKIQNENPDFVIEVTLPSKIQWITAAEGERNNRMYPWGNYYLRNKKGEFLCNFRRLGDQSIVRNKETGKPEIREEVSGLSDAAFFTSTVKSFYPNDFGLYNVCGNVSEMINEKGISMGGSWNDYGGDVQIRSATLYDRPGPTIGFRPVIKMKEKK